MKVIFLDIDGVLNNQSYLMQSSLEDMGIYRDIDRSRVLLLKEIITRTGARIVLSSSWKEMFDDHLNPIEEAAFYLLEILGQHGLELLDKTECMYEQRGEEIRKWLGGHPDVSSFIVLDDEQFDWADLRKCWVKTSYSRGLTRQEVEKAVAILNV